MNGGGGEGKKNQLSWMQRWLRGCWIKNQRNSERRLTKNAGSIQGIFECLKRKIKCVKKEKCKKEIEVKTKRGTRNKKKETWSRATTFLPWYIWSSFTTLFWNHLPKGLCRSLGGWVVRLFGSQPRRLLYALTSMKRYGESYSF